MLAAENFDIIRHITDRAWGPSYVIEIAPGVKMTLMSNGIAAMILVAILLILILLPLARRYQQVPSRGRNVLEVIVIFVRDMIARPALHDKAYRFLPFLLTLFVFILGMNLMGILPVEPVSEILGFCFKPLEGKTVGGAPTSIMAVCGGLALITLIMVLAISFRENAHRFHRKRGVPLILCWMISPVLWLVSLAPPIPGAAGYILKGPMLLVDLVGVFTRCGALMIRLFANMISGHTLIAVFLMLIMQSGASFIESHTKNVFFVAPVCILAGVAIQLLDLLVVVLQAYVFTFLTAIFIGLAMEEAH